jgi:hypothetical protein
MRVWTSQNIGVELVWPIDFVGVVARAGEKTKVFFAPRLSADDLGVHKLLPPRH